MWDPSSPARDRTHVPCVGRQTPTAGPPGKSLDWIFCLFLFCFVSIELYVFFIYFMVLGLTLKYLIHFELIFVHGIR